MAGERKPVTIHYRKFGRPEGGRSLEESVREAMNEPTDDGSRIRSRYLERLLTLGSDSYFVNTYQDGAGQIPLVFGDILHFTKGHLQALCKTADDKAAYVPVQQMKAPEQSEYVHSQMFWMIKGDHVFVLQSVSLKTPELEQYLEWLLKKRTSKLSETCPVILGAKFDVDAVGGDLGDIQEIIVGGVATPSPALSEVEAVDQEDRGAEFVEREVMQSGQIGTGGRAGWATARSILRELLGGDANVENLMRAVPPDAELNVQVHIGYQTKKRKIDRVALRQLETGLRHLPDSQLQVKSKGANLGADGTIRLHHNASIRLIIAQDGDSQVIGTLLDPNDVLRAMVEAYSTFVANGKISGVEEAKS